MRNKRQVGGKVLALAGAVAGLLTASVSAEPSVTITGATQRWPWNSKVDISYTVTDGGEDLSAGTYRKLVFTATIGGKTYTVDGASIGASAADGPHTVTWTAPKGVKPTSFTLTASLYASNVPSGDDYMIVDLQSGAVTYEGLYATQDASNTRYNTDAYKTTKMVLRKIAKGRSYTTGDDAHYASANSSKTWTPDYDFYVGIFQVTRTQYKQLYGTDPSAYVNFYTTSPGNIPEYRAVQCVSWDMLRGASTPPTTDLGANANGTFLERLNAKVGDASGTTGFDLPTEVMFEIAQRAGATTTFSWGSSMNTDYIVCLETTTNLTETTARPWAVGTKLPNNWGLYDTSGNVWEWCRDDNSLANLANARDPFTPAYTAGNTNYRTRGGGGYNSKALAGDEAQFRASMRNTTAKNNTGNNRGFRVAWVRW